MRTPLTTRGPISKLRLGLYTLRFGEYFHEARADGLTFCIFAHIGTKCTRFERNSKRTCDDLICRWFVFYCCWSRARPPELYKFDTHKFKDDKVKGLDCLASPVPQVSVCIRRIFRESFVQVLGHSFPVKFHKMYLVCLSVCSYSTCLVCLRERHVCLSSV